MIARRYMTAFFIYYFFTHFTLFRSNRISPQVMPNIIDRRSAAACGSFFPSNLTGWFYKWTGAHSHQKSFPAHDVCFFFSTFSSPLLSPSFISSFSQCQRSKTVFVLLCWPFLSRLAGGCSWITTAFLQVCLNRLPGPVLRREPPLNSS